jgi:MFS transporter, DHA2 family, multidrug resistance protein
LGVPSREWFVRWNRRHYALARGFQGLGYSFFFVREYYCVLAIAAGSKQSRVRNWGGSFGIVLITTVSERPHEFHQTNVGAAITSTSQQLAARAAELSNYLVAKGFTGPDAASAAQGYLVQQLQHQVSQLAFMDCFRIIAWLTLATVPLMLLIRPFKPGGKAAADH